MSFTMPAGRRRQRHSYYESFIGLSKGVTMLVLLPLVYRYALHYRPPNDFLFASAGMALGTGTYVHTGAGAGATGLAVSTP